MIRPARMGDVFRLVELLVQAHDSSRYAGKVAVDQPAARRTLAQFIQRNGGTHEGGTMVAVVEDDGAVQGFVAGLLDRVYHIGDKLAANDVFLVAAPDAPATTVRRLLAAYVTWANGVPDCVEVMLSHTDALASGERMGAIYERMGFVQCGAIYRRDTVRPQQGSDAQ